jgi:hypothetical protein
VSINIDLSKIREQIGKYTMPSVTGKTLAELTFKFSRLYRPHIDRDRIELIKDHFDGDSVAQSNVYVDRVLVTGSAPTYSVSNSVLTVTNGTGASSEQYLLAYQPIVPCFAVELKVTSWNATLGTDYANAMIALVKDASNRFLYMYDTYAQQFKLYRMVAGSGAEPWSSSLSGLTPPFRLILLFVGRRFFFLYEKDGIIKYLGGYTENTVDFLDPTVLSTYKIGFGQLLSNNKNISYDFFTIFLTAGFGLRDMVLATYRDGVTPIIRDGKMFITFGAAGDSIATTYGVLYALDLSTLTLEFKGITFFRNPTTGKIYNDHVTHITYDEVAKEYKIATSGWGRQGWGAATYSRVLIGTTTKDVLSEPISVVDVNEASLTKYTTANAYDPWLRYDDSAGKWRIFYCYGFGNIAIDENSSFSTTGWTNVSYSSYSGAEGCKMAKVKGTLYCLATSNETGVTSRMVYMDYPTLANRAAITVDKVPHTYAVTETPPHPMLIPIPIKGKTKYIIVTFDASRGYPATAMSWGNLWIYEATDLNDGYEYPVIKFLGDMP